MKRLAAAILVLGGGAIATLLLGPISLKAGNSASAAWEYHCVLPPGAMPAKARSDTKHDKVFHPDSSAHPSEKILNHLGKQGWELVAIDPNNGHYCFKRPGA